MDRGWLRGKGRAKSSRSVAGRPGRPAIFFHQAAKMRFSSIGIEPPGRSLAGYPMRSACRQRHGSWRRHRPSAGQGDDLIDDAGQFEAV